MKTYDLYLDSGPMKKKTFVHVPALLGCVTRGDTTDEALARAPDAIRAFLAFLARSGERADPAAGFAVRVAAHETRAPMSGNGLGFVPGDAAPLSLREADALLRRLDAVHAALRQLTAGLPARRLAAAPARGRPLARILAHICVEGAYLRGIAGSSRLQREVEEGRRDPHDALDELLALERERLHAMSDAERGDVIVRGSAPWSARLAVRRMLEHAWEHYAEIAERLGAQP